MKQYLITLSADGRDPALLRVVTEHVDGANDLIDRAVAVGLVALSTQLATLDEAFAVVDALAKGKANAA